MTTWHWLAATAIDRWKIAAQDNVSRLADADYLFACACSAERLSLFGKATETGWLLVPDGLENAIDQWIDELWNHWLTGTSNLTPTPKRVTSISEALVGDEPISLIELT